MQVGRKGGEKAIAVPSFLSYMLQHLPLTEYDKGTENMVSDLKIKFVNSSFGFQLQKLDGCLGRFGRRVKSSLATPLLSSRIVGFLLLL